MSTAITTKKGGRPSKLDDVVTERLVAAISAGASYSTACRQAGISRPTFAAWKRKGQVAVAGKYRIFFDRLAAAQEIALEKLSDALLRTALGGFEVIEKRQIFKDGKVIEEHVITKTAPANGGLLLQILERRDPATWAPKSNPLININFDEAIPVTVFGNVGFGTGNEGDDIDDHTTD
jgi:hypothetical protein